MQVIGGGVSSAGTTSSGVLTVSLKRKAVSSSESDYSPACGRVSFQTFQRAVLRHLMARPSANSAAASGKARHSCDPASRSLARTGISNFNESLNRQCWTHSMRITVGYRGPARGSRPG